MSSMISIEAHHRHSHLGTATHCLGKVDLPPSLLLATGCLSLPCTIDHLHASKNVCGM